MHSGLVLWRTCFTPVLAVESWSKALQGPQWVRAQGPFLCWVLEGGNEEGFVEEHWRWASLLGAQASGSRVWATSHQAVRQQVPPGCEQFPFCPLSHPAHSPTPVLFSALRPPSPEVEPVFSHIVTPCLGCGCLTPILRFHP